MINRKLGTGQANRTVTAKLIVSPSFASDERLTQRAGAAIVCVGDRDRGWQAGFP